MNTRLTDAEVQIRMASYNREVVELIAGLFAPKPLPTSLPDAEGALCDRVHAAKDAFLAVIREAMAQTESSEIENGLEFLIDAVGDHTPSKPYWEEIISSLK